jgi:uncharacterized phiE125 gp8 family phage protein
MTLTLIAGPAVEPITVAEAKAHLRIDGTAEDLLIASLILTSRLHIEAAVGLALITQSWQLQLDAWPPGNAVSLPLHPVRAVTAVSTTEADGRVATMLPSATLLDPGPPARLVRIMAAWPQPGAAANGIAITFTAGFGPLPSDVPAPIRQALLLLTAHWYEHRDPAEIGAPETAIPAAVSTLLSPYRRPRL